MFGTVLVCFLTHTPVEHVVALQFNPSLQSAALMHTKASFPHATQCQFLIKATKPNALYKADTLNMIVDLTGCGR